MENDMTVSRNIPEPSSCEGKPAPRRRKAGGIALMALASFVCCAAGDPDACQTTRIGPSNGEIAGIAVGVGAAVVVTVVLVNKAHHSMKGCVFAGQNGIEVRTEGDKKAYALSGVTENIKVGDLVQFHGSKVKKVKDSSGDQTFTVEKISKDFGPCAVTPSPAAGS
jgi:hypothetical protein